MKTPHRFVCIHGHFYQPPREDPWTGVVERQPSAGEDHDWNERVLRECYAPNAAAKLYDAEGKPAGSLNNYAWISFNFGPTLMSWVEARHPEVYQAILAADRESAERLSGHGNAIAQAYNHMILPLAHPRDQDTQIRWGLADFRHRFGRVAEALWIPETACDDGVLRRLAAHGLKYAILAPGQAQRARPLGDDGRPAGPWADVAHDALDLRRPYRWLDPDGGPSIDLFFYDGAIAQQIAFGRLMTDSLKAAERLDAAFDAAAGQPQLASVATDGETYGHHERFAELGLAHLLAVRLPELGLAPVNYGYFLSRQATPRWQVEIGKGPQGRGTSWSCAHGVGRWMTDCGCGAEPGKHLRWRAPLREALDWLRDRLAQATQREGARLLRDVWEARDAYIQVLLDPAAADAFLEPRLRRAEASSRGDALALMELQKFAMLMYTSCGWFFSDIAGLEAEQNLKYAARAVEIARERFGTDFEPEFLERLASAPSNDPERPDGAAVYRSAALARRASA